MKLIEYFNAFLKDTVNLDDARLGRLNTSVNAITNFLEGSATFAGNFIATIPQGSYAHKTIIRPVQVNDEFDADLLLYVQEFEDWSPADYVESLYACFRANGNYRDKVSRRTRCVTIDYAGDFHMDVVPFLERHGKKYITNRHDDDYELTNPEGYNAWLDEKDRVTNRNLVKVIRLVKYLRDYKNTFDVKSVILNVLLGDRANDAALMADPNCYADVPTTLRTVVKRLSDYVSINPVLPSIMDPSETGENFSDRWEQAGYTTFRTAIMRYAEWIEDAYTETDPARSLAKWQRVFGASFQAPKKQEASFALVKASSNLPATYRNTEQTLRDLGIAPAIRPAYRFRITGYVLKKPGMGAYYLKNRGNKVMRNRNIRFKVAECNVPTPYRLYWKVLNRGADALARDCIRGEITQGQETWSIEEPTVFQGPHFVECYVVKDGVCVAKDRQDVIIT